MAVEKSVKRQGALSVDIHVRHSESRDEETATTRRFGDERWPYSFSRARVYGSQIVP
jgi:hypothetical protein